MPNHQRLILLGLLSAMLVAMFNCSATAPGVAPEINSLLIATLFLLSFTVLLLEHFFSSPTHVIAAATSVLLLVIPMKPLLSSWGMWYWVFLCYEALAILAATAALLLLTDARGPSSRRNRASLLLKELAVKAAPGRAQYFLLFLLSLIFFVEPRSTSFIALLLYAAIVTFIQPQRIAVGLPARMKSTSAEIGEIFGVQGKNTFLIRLHQRGDRPGLRVGDLLEFSYGMDEPLEVRRGVVFERFFLDQSQWISALSHEDIVRESSDLPNLIDHRRDAVYKRADRDMGTFLGKLVGVVQDGTTIRTLRFLQAGRAVVQEGDLVQVVIQNQKVFYQVINAQVDTEALEKKNEADFVIGEATQLGQWNESEGSFHPFGWVPPARTPVTHADSVDPPAPDAREIELGKIPGTNFPVLLNKEEAISHHTAVLGVTGVGKSVLARHLVRQFAGPDVRIIVVDFTREWIKHTGNLGARPMLEEDESKPLRTAIDELNVEMSKFPNQRNKTYIDQRKRAIFEGFKASTEAFLKSDEMIRIFELPDVSNTEGVLEYTQWFFQTLFRIARDSGCYGKRVCIVLEEAHTVVPEWNFVGIADKSSQSLVNNISQIALQGRKYGVGFMIIAQRTASVSKTILTQCNTIIAFQCFDGTSIEFLGHYLPRSVAEALPNLRFRRAVAVGKAIRGSVPLIFDVPDIREEQAEESAVAPVVVAD